MLSEKKKAEDAGVDQALIAQQVREALLRAIPAPVDPATAVEMSAILSQVIDDVVRQCQHFPGQSDAIIAGAVAGVSGSLRTVLAGARERVNLRKANSLSTIVTVTAAAGAIAFVAYSVPTVPTLAAPLAMPLAPLLPALSEANLLQPNLNQEQHIQSVLRDVFDEATPLPPQVGFVKNEAGEWLLLMPLQPTSPNAAAHVLALPASHLRRVQVVPGEQGDWTIHEWSQPMPGATPGQVRFRHRELVWGQQAIQAAIGGDVTPESLSERLKTDAALMERLIAAHKTAQEKALMAAYLEEHVKPAPCLPCVDLPHFPVSLQPERLDSGALQAHSHDTNIPELSPAAS